MFPRLGTLGPDQARGAATMGSAHARAVKDCWADRRPHDWPCPCVHGHPGCGQKGTGRLGLCAEHERELLP